MQTTELTIRRFPTAALVTTSLLGAATLAFGIAASLIGARPL